LWGASHACELRCFRCVAALLLLAVLLLPVGPVAGCCVGLLVGWLVCLFGAGCWLVLCLCVFFCLLVGWFAGHCVAGSRPRAVWFEL